MTEPQIWASILGGLGLIGTWIGYIVKGAEFRGKVLEKLDHFEEILSSLRHDDGVLRASVNGMKTNMAAIETRVEDHDRRITNLENR